MQCRKLPHLRHSQIGVVGGEGDRVVHRVLHVLELHRACQEHFSIDPLVMIVIIMIFILYTVLELQCQKDGHYHVMRYSFELLSSMFPIIIIVDHYDFRVAPDLEFVKSGTRDTCVKYLSMFVFE